jgi:hypothetical protein
MENIVTTYLGNKRKIEGILTILFVGFCMVLIFLLTSAGQPQRLKRGIYFIDKVPIVYHLTEYKGALYYNNYGQYVNKNIPQQPQTYNLVYEVITSDGKCHVVVMPNVIK